MKAKILAILIILLATRVEAQVQINYGIPETSLSTASTGVVTGTVYNLPTTYAAIVTWQVVADGSALSVNLEGSADNITYATIDTQTTATGGVKNYGFTAIKYIRCSQVSRTGGTASTCTLTVSRGLVTSTFPGTISAGIFLTNDGSSTAPAYSFLSDSTKGFFSPTTNAIGVGVGGNELFRMSTSGMSVFSDVVGYRLGTGNDVTLIRGGAAGKVVLNGGTNNTLMFGGTTASFPSIKQVGTALQVIASDSSAFADLSVNSLIASASSTFNGGLTNTAAGGYAWNGRGMLTAPADGNVVINNAALTIGSRIKADALPTIGSGFGTSPSVTTGSTAFAGSVNVGTGGTATTGVITFNGTAFPSTPFCIYSNTTSNSVTRGTPTTTQLTLNTTTAWTASDIVTWQCVSAK